MSSVQKYPYLTVVNAPRLIWKVGNPEKEAVSPTTEEDGEQPVWQNSFYKWSRQVFELTENLTLFANVNASLAARSGADITVFSVEGASTKFSFSWGEEEQSSLGIICWGTGDRSARYYAGIKNCPDYLNPLKPDQTVHQSELLLIDITQFAIIKGDFMNNETGAIGEDGREDFAITALDGSILVLLGENDSASQVSDTYKGMNL